MDLSLNLEDLLSIFESYNRAIWPMQVLAYIAGLLAVYAAAKETRSSNNIASAILSFFWLWTGVVFCLFHWAPTYPAAYAFAVLLTTEGLMFAYHVVAPGLSFRAGRNRFTYVGVLCVVYAMIGYPLIGWWLGHSYPRSLPFGLAPCPTTVFTLGLLMLTAERIPRYLMIIPALVAVAAIKPISAGIYEDVGLLIAGIVCLPMLMRRDREAREQESPSR